MRAAFAPALAAVALAIAAAGCGLRHETAPAITIPGSDAPAQIAGTVARAGQPLPGLKVKLYDDATGVLAESTFAAASGAYGFAGVPAGRWMVKVSSAEPGDFGYVRYFFDLASAGETRAVPPFDLAAHGLALEAPAAGATVARPDFSSPLAFSWSAYQAPFQWTSAQVSDSSGVAVWSAPRTQATTASWNGFGNEGPYAGLPAPAGRYRWRVKVRLPNTVQAATVERELALQVLQ